MEEEVLKMENWGLIKENWGCMMENWGLRIQKWGWRVVDWGYTNKIWGVDHATPIFNTNNFGLPLSRITLFWGYFETLNLPLEDILQLFPGLHQCQRCRCSVAFCAPCWEGVPSSRIDCDFQILVKGRNVEVISNWLSIFQNRKCEDVWSEKWIPDPAWAYCWSAHAMWSGFGGCHSCFKNLAFLRISDPSSFSTTKDL